MQKIKIKMANKKQYKTFLFTDVWARVMGEPEKSGCWLIWGAEKNGKTWFALKLAEYLSGFEKTLYMSGEEGLRKTFTDAIKRAKLDEGNKNIEFSDSIVLKELEEELKKRRSAKVILIDNITVYEELKYGGLKRLLSDNPDKLFIFLAHEENKQPYTSTAKIARKLAQIIIHVEGLAGQVSGRCPGGILHIDEAKAQLYWGANNIDQTSKNNTHDTH